MKFILGVLGALFTGLIVWAFSQKPLGESADLLLKDPWGIVTLADLYLGFFLVILFIFYTCKNKGAALLWSGTLLVLGNVVSVIYIICYLSGIGVKNGVKK